MISGEPSIIEAILTGEKRPTSHPMMFLMRVSITLTCIFLLFTEVFARVSICSISSIALTSPSIASSLPFSSLNLSFGLGILFQILANTVKGPPVAHYSIGMGLMLPLLLVVNKKARQHLLTRLWQWKESRVVGRESRVKDLHGMTHLCNYPLMLPTLGAYPFTLM